MDRTEHLRGRLFAGDQLLMDHVEGHLRTRPKPGNAHGEWSGYFEFSPEIAEKLSDGGRYRIVLTDGRSGHVYIHVRKDDPMGLGRKLADFQGNGSVRR